MKICSDCKQSLDEAQYYTRNGKLYSECKACHNRACREWKQKNPENVKALRAKYREANRQHLREYQRQWYQANREKVLERVRQRYHAKKKDQQNG